MAVYLIRHACAGDKQRWRERDTDRPLDPVGIRQADVLAQHLATAPIHRLLTSPAHRCVQTVEPIARSHDLPIETHDDLAPDGDPGRLRDLITALDATSAALCTHGELMRPLLASLRDAGTRIVAQRDDDEWLLAKGTAWALTMDPTGAIVVLEHLAPRTLPACPDHERAGV
jgi:phosphohistidine phosphatase SixA